MSKTFVVEGTLLGPKLGEKLEHGAEFTSDDEALIAHLLKLGAIKYPSEALAPEDVSAKLARLTELEAQLAAAKSAEAQGAPVPEDQAQVEAEIADIKETAVRGGRR